MNMEMHKIHAIQRYQIEQIHLDASSPYDGGLRSKPHQTSLKFNKQRVGPEKDASFQELLNSLLDTYTDH